MLLVVVALAVGWLVGRKVRLFALPDWPDVERTQAARPSLSRDRRGALHPY